MEIIKQNEINTDENKYREILIELYQEEIINSNRKLKIHNN